MDLGLKGKVGMVAGASRGLGFAVARALAREGVRVSILSRTPESIREAAEEIERTTGGDVLPVAGDVRRADDIEKWAAETRAELGDPELLFTNSGGPEPGSFDDLDDRDWEDAFELLVLSAVRTIRQVAPDLKSTGGSILLSTSSSVKEPIPNLTLSNVVRGSVVSLAKSLALEWAEHGVRVNQIIPGRVATDRVEELDQASAKRAGVTVDEVRDEQESEIPMGRYGSPEEFGRAAAFLLSDAASYVTGASLQVDGGRIRSVM